MILTRAAALARLEQFLPHAGADYAHLRNLDPGPEAPGHVSRLSSALRRRLITEEEVAEAVLARHGWAGEVFLSEILWRSYWKGWMEHRPGFWSAFRVEATRKAAQHWPGLAQAQAGQTGIDCFDSWSAELASTGYLHNWARMQFASIWVFTLGLPWELGADHMGRQLGDFDPACNTLSWRWVAGLQTKGKAYLADPERIAALTGRFAPKGLASEAAIPQECLPTLAPVPLRAMAPLPQGPCLFLLTPEDLCPESLAPEGDVAALAVLAPQSPADAEALADGLARARALWPKARDLGALSPEMLRSIDLPCVTAYLPQGPSHDRLAGLPRHEIQRPWDARIWPHCQKGYFKLRQKLRSLIQPCL
jgi:deoxyribodipyrimidine photo-lyase